MVFTYIEQTKEIIMNLSEQYMNMSEASAFEVSDNPQRSDTDGATWVKNDEVAKLGKLLGLNVPKNFTWGDYDTELNGIGIDVTADRSKPVIVITVGNNYEKRIRIKGSLSASQIKNLRKKIEKQAQELDDAMNLNSKISDARAKLNKSGINISSDKNMTVGEVNLYYKDGKVESSDSIYLSNRYIGSVKVKDGEKGVDKILANFKKEIMKELGDTEKAVKKAEKNIDGIKYYYELVDKR